MSVRVLCYSVAVTEVSQAAVTEASGRSQEQERQCQFVVKRQEYLELLESRQLAEALACLQTQLTPLASCPSKVGLALAISLDSAP